MDNSSFINEFSAFVYQSLSNFYSDNIDYQRFGVKPRFNPYHNFINFLKSTIKQKFNIITKKEFKLIFDNILINLVNIDALGQVYDVLNDEQSKSIFIKILSYSILGQTRVMLPLNNPRYWKSYDDIETCLVEDDEISLFNSDWKLRKFKLNNFGFPITFFMHPYVINLNFLQKQYEYNIDNTLITVENDDYVIDGGGCWGDTALLFSHLAGKNGKVYTFEFDLQNIQILQKNLALNPQLMERIELIEKPLWSNSTTKVTMNSSWAGSSIGENLNTNHCHTTTLSIDDFVNHRQIQKIDFIKMDIEGAEMKALIGAKDTIVKYSPKLAISIYHKPDDKYQIPLFILSLNHKYKFYLKHNTTHNEETILFAII